MTIFITGTDTNVGKTIVCSWLCAHTGYDYFKPIQTGLSEGRDRDTVACYARVHVHPEAYTCQAPLSPHAAAALEGQIIDHRTIKLPSSKRLIVEGAGGVLVPINEEALMVDLMEQFDASVMVVALSRLGMINHTLLSLEVLRARNIPVLGVILTGQADASSKHAIEHHGHVPILAELPWLPEMTYAALKAVPLSPLLMSMLEVS